MNLLNRGRSTIFLSLYIERASFKPIRTAILLLKETQKPFYRSPSILTFLSNDLRRTGRARKWGPSQEKNRVAISSLLVAVTLTSLKAIVGITTNSLGIISEALHSGLDLAAAATTVYAVRTSSKPPDEDHLYGHGKYESFSALVETLLLLATCAWITYEAIQRLFFRETYAEASLLGFGVMMISIVLDFSRSRALSRVAKKYRSQALEADALHFSTDILSSLTVIAGLLFLRLGFRVADPLAALGVVVVVVVLSLRLGKRTVFVLLDKAPEGLAEAIRSEVLRIPGVYSCGQVRVRPSGTETFVDLQVYVDRSTSFERVNALAFEVEQAIRKLEPNSDIVVRTRPTVEPETGLAERVRKVASQIDGVRGIHNLEVHDAENGLHVEMHLEADPDASLETAHRIATKLESAIKSSISEVAEVVTHIESTDEMPLTSADVTSESRRIVSAVRDAALQVPGVKRCRDIAVHNAEDGLHLTLTCVLDAGLSVSQAHELSTRIENALLARVGGSSRVLVHVEPDVKGSAS
jgi:cation diffusion facilitator family transporter